MRPGIVSLGLSYFSSEEAAHALPQVKGLGGFTPNDWLQTARQGEGQRALGVGRQPDSSLCSEVPEFGCISTGRTRAGFSEEKLFVYYKIQQSNHLAAQAKLRN